MRIGIFFTATKSHGGVYQYSLAILESLAKIKSNTYVVFTTSPDVPKEYYHHKSFQIVNLSSSGKNIFFKFRNFVSLVLATGLPKLTPFLFRHNLFWLIAIPEKISNLANIKAIESENLDFMIYPTSSSLSYLANVPSAVAIHDLAHRLYPHFPEVSAGGHWEIREHGFREMTKKANYILVDSEIGKEDVLNCYPKTRPDHIIVLPFLPPSYLDKKTTKKEISHVVKKYSLTPHFFYYPANFWTHKHHSTLIKALKICHDQGYKFTLALTGSKGVEFSVYDTVMKEVRSLGIDKYVKYLGYVDSKEISALYKGAIALTMPTNFGPSNIPVLEAWSLGTPVIYSNVRGCKEQLGDAGISISPTDSEAWANAMIKIATNPDFAKACVKKGKSKLSNWTEKDFHRTVAGIIKSL